ncbi:hypothetical protein BDP27DRAFT_1430547 [Rhodocollybia butyracea]|uniref:AB hydrolase-1 domain-containing protein n=1 Tax=Rhodocollybia butyracea TaxID=206335 RepID=A0A9P5TZ60_9AGAR|nr:hypothetical protein BDP27DRAFT_1430547 [Rhodocollybia butyracea]
MFITDYIVVSVNPDSPITFSFIDSGPPSHSSQNYDTVLMVHGNSFSNAIFKRLLPLHSKFNIRVVALSRRGYTGSTPFTLGERAILEEEGSVAEDAKAEFLEMRGVEVLHFIDGFIQRSTIPAVQESERGCRGGLTLVGWSLGSVFTFAAIAHVDSRFVSDDMRTRFGQYIRAYLMLEPATTNLGLSVPREAWIPLRDPNIPAHARGWLFSLLVTGYYDYSDEVLATRDQDTVLATIAPSTSRIPTIFTFNKAERDEIVILTPESSVDLLLTKVLNLQIRQVYHKACYDKQLRSNEALKRMTIWEIAGDRSYSFIWPAFWEIEKDDIEAGAGVRERFVRFKVLKGVNHFMHWDEPEKTMSMFRDILDMPDVIPQLYER